MSYVEPAELVCCPVQDHCTSHDQDSIFCQMDEPHIMSSTWLEHSFTAKETISRMYSMNAALQPWSRLDQSCFDENGLHVLFFHAA